MNSLVVVFPKLEDAKCIRDICVRHVFDVDVVCTTAAAALSEMNNLDGGIVICGYSLSDMVFTELSECMPAGFDMLLIASNRVLSSLERFGIMSVSMPLSAYDLVNTLLMMQQKAVQRKIKKNRRQKKRSRKEQEIIDSAKALLIERNHMTESEAHYYIQKCSMNNGRNLVETAQMILTLMSC